MKKTNYKIAGKKVTKKQFKNALQHIPKEHADYIKKQNPELNDHRDQTTSAATGANKVSDHTPTPWKISREALPSDRFVTIKDATGTNEVAFDVLRADAEFIIRAVNSHEALLEAVRLALDVVPAAEGFVRNELRKAIAQAEARP